ncbi:hypothetical protein ATSB10_23700 [Dyella thiooxydans]|uniref:Uncharacterized protein n=1 Tax=Dyella thiooxydans TaxID=445710 RepID=A0A160N2I3_9GAMM|nr:hypothetical protein ATSB10_23700 [Dyella thiooxydans]
MKQKKKTHTPRTSSARMVVPERLVLAWDAQESPNLHTRFT